MGTRLTSVVVDANDLEYLAQWWATALGWRVQVESPDEVCVVPPEGAPGVELTFCPVVELKRIKNRIHLDLATTSEADQTAFVDRLVVAGARKINSRHPWVVLADPDDNEFCVLDPRAEETDTGAVASIVMDVLDPRRQADFWSEAAGWPIVVVQPGGARLRAPTGKGPFLDLVRVPEPKGVKNRLHLDVAPLKGESQAGAVERLEEAGAVRADVGQGADVTWVVLADPEGQEFCVLSPR